MMTGPGLFWMEPAYRSQCSVCCCFLMIATVDAFDEEYSGPSVRAAKAYARKHFGWREDHEGRWVCNECRREHENRNDG